jgi:hypothetical protein
MIENQMIGMIKKSKKIKKNFEVFKNEYLDCRIPDTTVEKPDGK